MNQINFYLNNNKINPPANWRELAIEANFEDGEFITQQVTINNWDFVRENIDTIQTWISNGRIFEGIPFKIEEVQEENGLIVPIFNGYLDPSDDAIFDEYSIKIKSKDKYSIDWLNDVASSFTFEYLEHIGILTNADYIDIPYVLSSIPNYKETAIALISLTLTAQMLLSSSAEIVATIAALESDAASYGEVFRLIAQIINFISSIIVLILLIKKIYNLLVQKVKYHKGIQVKKLFEKGCAYLGLTFNSTAIPDDWYVLPKKLVVPKNPSEPDDYGILGAFQPNEFPQYGYPKDNFADFIIKMKTMFNGKIMIDPFNNNLMLERRDFNIKPPAYTIPPIMNTTYKLNTYEIVSNLYIEMQTDNLESNTITQYKGAGYQVLQQPLNYTNKELVLMKGLKQIEVQYALGKKKTSLTTVEKVFDNLLDALQATLMPFINTINAGIDLINDLIDTINDFIKFFNDVNDLPIVGGIFAFDFPTIPTVEKIPSPELNIIFDNRIGMLLLENDYFTQDKLLRLYPDGKLNENQPSTKFLYDNYYIIDMVDNQFKLKEYQEVPFTTSDYLKVKDNPNIFNEDGVKTKVISLEYNPWENLAKVKLKIPYTYTNNLQLTYNEPTGE